jgi:hypothetical protein
MAYLGLFPLGWRWDQREAGAGLGMLLAAFSVLLVLVSQTETRARSAHLPAIVPAWYPAGVALALAWAVASRLKRRSAAVVAAALVVVIAISGFGLLFSQRARVAHAAAVDADRVAAALLAAGRPPASASRELALRVEAAEMTARVGCDSRRFYSIVRFDDPLMLYSATVPTLTFYVGRDAALARRRLPARACDYVIATTDLLATTRGPALLSELAGARPVRHVASAGGLLAFRLP